jgi:hypothetical protein
MKSTLITVFMAFSLTSCGVLPNRLGPEKISPSDLSGGSAIVILSAGAPSPCTSTGTELDIKPADEPYSGSNAAYMPVDFSIVKSDFSDHHGFLHVIKLAPGNYYITSGIANPYVQAIKIPKYDFSVSAGEVVYLGEYYLAVSCVWNTASQFRDQEERDIMLLKKKNPAFSNVKIVKRIPLMSGYAIGGLN